MRIACRLPASKHPIHGTHAKRAWGPLLGAYWMLL
jgi:hypothetical protein